MIAIASTHPGRHAWRMTARVDAAAAIRRARRHSRLVRFLRVGIPGGLVLILALYMLVSWLNPLSALSSLPSISNLVISGSRVTMDSPRLAGYSRDGRPYELTAAAAAQDLKQPQFIELKEIRAKVEMRGGTVMNLTADTGVYDTKAETVVLRHNILVTTTDGNEVRMSEALMDVQKGQIVSRQPVQVFTANGRLDAQQMEVAEQGSVIRFHGGVTMDIRSQETSLQSGQAERTR